MRKNRSLYDDAFTLTVEGRIVEAFEVAMECLSQSREHVECNILVGELWLWDAELLPGYVDGPTAVRRAIEYFQRACSANPRHADAWSDLAMAMRYDGKYRSSLDASVRGLQCLEDRAGYLEFECAHRAVGEALYASAAYAALNIGDLEQAYNYLTEGVRRFGDDNISKLEVYPIVMSLKGKDPGSMLTD
jgi:tetratricopeptide (TPR) repeat protein